MENFLKLILNTDYGIVFFIYGKNEGKWPKD